MAKQNEDQIKIGPIAYAIKYVKRFNKDKDGSYTLGEADNIERVIRLVEHQTKDSEFTICWHEVIHAIDAVYDLNFTEQDTNLLSVAIAQVLQDNPRMNWTEVQGENKSGKN